MDRRFVTAQDVQSLPEGSILDLPEGALITDLAREWIEKKKIKIAWGQPKVNKAPPKVRIALASDHGGFTMKEALKKLLDELGESYIDHGTRSTASVDYPDFAHAVARSVALGQAEIGIILDGAGIGSAMTANKVPGIRAAACYDEATARNSREHNDANVLTLGARLISPETMAGVVKTFLTTSITEERHKARVRKIVSIEKKYYRPV
jgi:ribose 5-phosphate isomerase B